MRFYKKTWVILIIIVALATFLRLFLITTTPPGLYPDEAMNGNNALEALEMGSFKAFYTENNGREGLFINIQAGVMGLISLISPTESANINKSWIIRLPSAIFGILTVLGVFFLTKELFQDNHKHQAPNYKQITNSNDQNSKRFRIWDLGFGISRSEQIALLAAFFLAVSFWHINFSRIAFRAIMAPAFLTWGLYLLLLSFREFKKSRWSKVKGQLLLPALAGAVYGLGFHSYIAYRATPLLIVFSLLLLAFRYGWKRAFKIGSIFIAAAIIIFLPLGFYFLENPADFLGRTSQISIFNSSTPLKDLGTNILRTAGMFNFSGDWNWRHNIAGKPLLFWPVGILFLVGIALAATSILKLFRNYPSVLRSGSKEKLEIRNLYNKKLAPSLILLAWLVVASIPVIVSNEGLPHSLRAILMIPPVLILAAYGGVWLYHRLLKKGLSKKLLVIGCVLLVTIIIAEATYSYFEKWGKNKHVAGAFSQNYVKIAKELNRLPKELQKYIVVEAGGVDVRGIPMPAQTVMFITDTFSKEKQREKNIHYILPDEKNTVPLGSSVVTIK